MSQTAAAEITVEELAQKAAEKRTTKPAEGAGRTATSELDTTIVDVVCEKCGNDFERVTVVRDGRPLFANLAAVCPECVDKEQKHEMSVVTSFGARVQARDQETAIRELLEDAGANPWEHGAATFDTFDTAESGPKPLGIAREFAAAVKGASKYDPVRGLYLHGDTGTGKTRLAVSVGRWLIEEGYDAKQIVFDHAAELIARIQDTYGRKEDSTFAVLEKRFKAGLWILDDFGTERVTDDVVRHLTLIFGRRAMRPTLVTSNFSPERLDRERPELMRVLSRLGPQYFKTVAVAGRDRRFD